MSELDYIKELMKSNRLAEAESAVRKIISENESAEAYNVLGNILNAKNRITEAGICYRKAIAMSPEYVNAWNNIGNILNHEGRVDEAIAHYRRTLELNPHLLGTHSNLIQSMYYSSAESAETIIAETKRWYLSHCSDIVTQCPETSDLRPDKKLTLGYVSGDFCMHPVGFFLQAVLENHNRHGFRVICYSTGYYNDWLTEILRKSAEWRQAENWGEDTFIEHVKIDGVDILVDLSGHTPSNRLRVFARRAAPVQVSWLGFHGTTGIPAMDYYISDIWTVPPGEEKWYTEEVIRLEGSRFCYSPPKYAQQRVAARSLRDNIVFGSFNNLAKVTPLVVQTWSRILKAVDGSTLVLKWHTMSSQDVRERWFSLFADCGIMPERLEFRVGSSHPDMLREYDDIDIALDPFPYSGGLTSCEALYSGVPVVTLASDRPVGRQSVAFLKLLELDQLIASKPDDYVDVAVTLANDTGERELIRSALPIWMSDRICDGLSFTCRLESTFRKLWQIYCRNHGAIGE